MKFISAYLLGLTLILALLSIFSAEEGQKVPAVFGAIAAGITLALGLL